MVSGLQMWNHFLSLFPKYTQQLNQQDNGAHGILRCSRATAAFARNGQRILEDWSVCVSACK